MVDAAAKAARTVTNREHYRLQAALVALRNTIMAVAEALPDQSGVRDHVVTMWDAMEAIRERFPDGQRDAE